MNNTYWNYLEHSAKGSTWKKHKYVKMVDGKYYYNNDKDNSKKANINVISKQEALQKRRVSGIDIPYYDKATIGKYKPIHGESLNGYSKVTRVNVVPKKEAEFNRAINKGKYSHNVYTKNQNEADQKKLEKNRDKTNKKKIIF